MKDSGVEWLGEVPENWKVSSLAYLTTDVSVGIVVGAMTNTDVITMHWRGLDLEVRYSHRLWGGAKDRIYIKASEPFYKGGPDDLPIFFPSLGEALESEDVCTIAEIWLDEWLGRSARFREADVERMQLSLF